MFPDFDRARHVGKAARLRMEAEYAAAVLGETVMIVGRDGVERFEPALKQLPEAEA